EVRPSPAVERQLERAHFQGAGVDEIVTCQAVDDKLVYVPFTPCDVDAGRQARNDHCIGRAAHDDLVIAAGSVDDDGVGLPIACAAAGRVGQIKIDLGDIGAGEVADGDPVGAAKGGNVNLFDAVEVHGDVADVSEEAHPAAVGRQVHVLADIGAFELQD